MTWKVGKIVTYHRVTCDLYLTCDRVASFFLTTILEPSCIMDVNSFGRSNNGNTVSNVEDRYDTTKPRLNLLSTSHSRAYTENERSNKPLDHLGAFSQQISSLKLSKRLEKNNPISEPGDRPLLLLQPQRRLHSQVPPRLSAPYFSSSIPRKPSPVPTASPVASLNLQKTNDNTSDRMYLLL